MRLLCDGPEARFSAAMGLLDAATAEVVAAIAEALGGRRLGEGITTT